MKKFDFINVDSFAEASEALQSRKAVAMAGGTDLLGVLKEKLLPEYPEQIVNLKKIPGAAEITEDTDGLTIGAMARLVDVVESECVAAYAPALSAAAKSVATPLIRNMGTIGGNVCQDVRCWFYRYPHEVGGRLNCARKGGNECFAIRGDNRYHSIFGGMKTGLTPCTRECPAQTDIPGYMSKYREGDIDSACRILMQANPMPMMTARVCAHTCQNVCNRCTSDESVNIHGVERVLGDYILAHADVYYQAPQQETGKKIALVGSGPAGLTAAYYLRKAGHDVTVYDAEEEAGGCLMYAIPAFRLPKHYVRDLVKAYKDMGVKFVMNTRVGKDVEAGRLEQEYDKVFYATGAWERPVLGFDGEEFTEFGLQFLLDVNKWVNKKEREHVLVVGGGNVSMDVAITAKRLGAKSVTLACLEQRDEMPASAEEVARALEEGIVIRNGFGVSRAIIEDNKLVGMELKVCTAVFDENGRFNPQYDESQKTVIEADSILMAAGQKVDLSFLKDDYQLAQKRGLIAVDEAQKTSRPNIFAGGDATSGPTTVVKAIRSGAVAARTINRELGAVNPPKYVPEGFIHFAAGCEKMDVAVKDHQLSVADRALDKEDSSTLTDEEGKAEAARCMNCGCYSVNASDLSPVLVALDADIVTTAKTVKAENFFTANLKVGDTLESGELIQAIRLPKAAGWKSDYVKFRLRDAIDFAIVSLASNVKMEDGKIAGARLVLGGVAPIPVRLCAVEELLVGKAPNEALAAEAAELAVADAIPMSYNSYKVQEVRTMIEKFVLSLI